MEESTALDHASFPIPTSPVVEHQDWRGQGEAEHTKDEDSKTKPNPGKIKAVDWVGLIQQGEEQSVGMSHKHQGICTSVVKHSHS